MDRALHALHLLLLNRSKRESVALAQQRLNTSRMRQIWHVLATSEEKSMEACSAALSLSASPKVNMRRSSDLWKAVVKHQPPLQMIVDHCRRVQPSVADTLMCSSALRRMNAPPDVLDSVSGMLPLRNRSTFAVQSEEENKTSLSNDLEELLKDYKRKMQQRSVVGEPSQLDTLILENKGATVQQCLVAARELSAQMAERPVVSLDALEALALLALRSERDKREAAAKVALDFYGTVTSSATNPESKLRLQMCCFQLLLASKQYERAAKLGMKSKEFRKTKIWRRFWIPLLHTTSPGLLLKTKDLERVTPSKILNAARGLPLAQLQQLYERVESSPSHRSSTAPRLAIQIFFQLPIANWNQLLFFSKRLPPHARNLKTPAVARILQALIQVPNSSAQWVLDSIASHLCEYKMSLGTLLHELGTPLHQLPLTLQCVVYTVTGKYKQLLKLAKVKENALTLKRFEPLSQLKQFQQFQSWTDVRLALKQKPHCTTIFPTTIACIFKRWRNQLANDDDDEDDINVWLTDHGWMTIRYDDNAKLVKLCEEITLESFTDSKIIKRVIATITGRFKGQVSADDENGRRALTKLLKGFCGTSYNAEYSATLWLSRWYAAGKISRGEETARFIAAAILRNVPVKFLTQEIAVKCYFAAGGREALDSDDKAYFAAVMRIGDFNPTWAAKLILKHNWGVSLLRERLWSLISTAPPHQRKQIITHLFSGLDNKRDGPKWGEVMLSCASSRIEPAIRRIEHTLKTEAPLSVQRQVLSIAVAFSSDLPLLVRQSPIRIVASMLWDVALEKYLWFRIAEMRGTSSESKSPLQKYVLGILSDKVQCYKISRAAVHKLLSLPTVFPVEAFVSVAYTIQDDRLARAIMYFRMGLKEPADVSKATSALLYIAKYYQGTYNCFVLFHQLTEFMEKNCHCTASGEIQFNGNNQLKSVEQQELWARRVCELARVCILRKKYGDPKKKLAFLRYAINRLKDPLATAVVALCLVGNVRSTRKKLSLCAFRASARHKLWNCARLFWNGQPATLVDLCRAAADISTPWHSVFRAISHPNVAFSAARPDVLFRMQRIVEKETEKLQQLQLPEWMARVISTPPDMSLIFCELVQEGAPVERCAEVLLNICSAALNSRSSISFSKSSLAVVDDGVISRLRKGDELHRSIARSLLDCSCTADWPFELRKKLKKISQTL